MNNIECVEVVQQIPLVITTLGEGCDGGGDEIPNHIIERIEANRLIVTVDKEILRDPTDSMINLPPKTLLTHNYRGVEYKFVVGQMVKYEIEEGSNEYIYYILLDINDDGAVWGTI